MKLKWSVVIYAAICNIQVCLFLCLASSVIAVTDFESSTMTVSFGDINWLSFGINYAVAFILAMCVGVFVPLTAIGRWFTALFHVKNDTYTGNVPYRLLATLITSVIFYVTITPTLTLMNYLMNKFWFGVETSPTSVLISMLIAAPIMLLVGFTSSLISDIFAYKVAHKVDDTF